MAREHLYLFCYDVCRNSVRQRMARELEEMATRVQKSVFEGRLSQRQADALTRRLAVMLDPGDSLRVYRMALREAVATRVFGAGPPVEAHDFYLF